MKNVYKNIIKAIILGNAFSYGVEFARIHPNWSGVPAILFAVLGLILFYKPLKRMNFFD